MVHDAHVDQWTTPESLVVARLQSADRTRRAPRRKCNSRRFLLVDLPLLLARDMVGNPSESDGLLFKRLRIDSSSIKSQGDPG